MGKGGDEREGGDGKKKGVMRGERGKGGDEREGGDGKKRVVRERGEMGKRGW